MLQGEEEAKRLRAKATEMLLYLDSKQLEIWNARVGYDPLILPINISGHMPLN